MADGPGQASVVRRRLVVGGNRKPRPPVKILAGLLGGKCPGPLGICPGLLG